jgi:hypothetical protein
MHTLPLLGSLLLYFTLVRGSVTVYNQQPLGATGTAAAANYTAAAAFDPLVLTPPPIPNPPPPTTFFLQLHTSAAAFPGLSIVQSGSFMGFSVEFSVIDQLCEFM